MLIYGNFCVVTNELAAELFNKTSNLSDIGRASDRTLL